MDYTKLPSMCYITITINDIFVTRKIELKLIIGYINMLKIGAKAPEFQLSDQDNNTVNISDFKGQKVVLWFYPKASTPG